MKPFGVPALLLGFSFATVMARRGVKRKSLSPNGAVAAWVVGFFMLGSGLRGFGLICFYFVGTKATKYHHQEKTTMDASAASGAVRGPQQVLAVSALAVICSLMHVWYCGEEQAISEFATDHHVVDIIRFSLTFVEIIRC